jgi:hypothetical protein
MTDLHDLRVLNDAFTELDRRADAFARPAPATHSAVLLSPAPPASPRRRYRVPLVAATITTVLAVAIVAALLASGSGTPGTQAGGATTPAQQTTPSPPQTIAATSTNVVSTSSAPFQLPSTPAQLEIRLRAVLAGTATFTVTSGGPGAVAPVSAQATVGPLQTTTSGAAIVGTLTAGGKTGGFGLDVFNDFAGDKARCDVGANCTTHDLPDGSSLATGTTSLGAGGVTYEAVLIRTDGVEFVLHVSNERDAKGDSAVLAPQPPLTTEQMTAIVTSTRW